ncbi:formate dehydrogenase accessory sulfurtransferase FdhD [Urinicoccus massiliensis]|nr:formate dehydrogenase accessory sulfurtransferase FdhD [Urinicoccus massiliensis]
MEIVKGSAPRSAIQPDVDLAKEYNVTLLGFTRGNRFNIYTNPDKVD